MFESGRQGIAELKIVVSNQREDIAGAGNVQGFAFLTEKALRIGEPHDFAGARVRHLHVPLEGARNDSDESGSVAVLGIHVRLNLENESRECLVGWFDDELS